MRPRPPCVVGYEVAGTILELGEGAANPDRPLSHRTAGRRGHGLRWVRLAGGRPRRWCAAAAGRALLRAGRGDTRQLRDGLDGAPRLRQPAGGRTRADPAAAGGVGIAATQVAKRQGAEVYGTASPGKHARISELGVDHPLDYTKPGWERGLPQFDVIMDAIGGASFRRSYELLGGGGRLIAFGASAVVSGERRNPISAVKTALRMPRFNLIKQMSASKSVIGLNMYTLSQDERRRAQVSDALRELAGDGTIQPVVAGDVLLRGSRRRAEHDHRTAQCRQGGARPIDTDPGSVVRRCVRRSS